MLRIVSKIKKKKKSRDCVFRLFERQGYAENGEQSLSL